MRIFVQKNFKIFKCCHLKIEFQILKRSSYIWNAGTLEINKAKCLLMCSNEALPKEIYVVTTPLLLMKLSNLHQTLLLSKL